MLRSDGDIMWMPVIVQAAGRTTTSVGAQSIISRGTIETPPPESSCSHDRRAHACGLLMSLNMPVESRGGFDFTGAECQSWMAEPGFSTSRVEHLVEPVWMVVARK